MILKDRPLADQAVTGPGVVDHVRFIDRKVHVEQNIEGFSGEVALPGDLEVDVNEQFQPVEGVLKFGSQGITVGVQVHIPEVDRRSAGVPQVRVLRVHGGREVVNVPALIVQEGHDGVDVQISL